MKIKIPYTKLQFYYVQCKAFMVTNKIFSGHQTRQLVKNYWHITYYFCPHRQGCHCMSRLSHTHTHIHIYMYLLKSSHWSQTVSQWGGWQVESGTDFFGFVSG